MRTQIIEKANIEVSAVCLGTMHFGTVTDAATSYGILDKYIEAGGNFIDTANNYATWVPGSKGGESEALLGKWMKDRGNRSRIFIASKVGFPVPADKMDMGFSAKQIETECNRSLKRLGIETIDLYYAHHDDRNTPLEESLEVFQRLIKAGKVRFIGASNFMTWRLEKAHWLSQNKGWPEFCCIQQRFSYLRPVSGAEFDPQIAASSELLDYCQTQGMRLLAYSPLLGGVYNIKNYQLDPHYQSPENEIRLTALREVTDELGATPIQVVLAWLIQSKPEVIPLLGAENQEQLNDNLGALVITLSEDQIFKLSTAGNISTSHFDAKLKKNRLSK